MPDTEKPTAPQNLSATGGGAGQVNLTWQAASDNVQSDRIRRLPGRTGDRGPRRHDFVHRHRPPARHLQLHRARARTRPGTSRIPATRPTVTVPDTTNPTAPSNLGATAQGQTRIDLTWQASTDDVGVTGYRIYRGGGLLASVGTVTSYSDTSVSAGNSYSYEVRAVDGAGHLSGPSNTATATTPARRRC